MKTLFIHALPAALLALEVISCSPIVAEYTYRGTVSGTSSRTGARMLTLKEYRDGTVSGKLSIPSSSAAEPYSCGSIGGRADDRRITFYLTSLGDSYLSAKMALRVIPPEPPSPTEAISPETAATSAANGTRPTITAPTSAAAPSPST